MNILVACVFPYCKSAYAISWSRTSHGETVIGRKVYLNIVQQYNCLILASTSVFDFVFFIICFCRVFADRLVDDADNEAFVGFLTERLGTLLDLSYHNLCPNKASPIFGK